VSLLSLAFISKMRGENGEANGTRSKNFSQHTTTYRELTSERKGEESLFFTNDWGKGERGKYNLFKLSKRSREKRCVEAFFSDLRKMKRGVNSFRFWEGSSECSYFFCPRAERGGTKGGSHPSFLLRVVGERGKRNSFIPSIEKRRKASLFLLG